MFFAARTIPIGTGDTVTTKHGMVLLTATEKSAPPVDTVVVPGAATHQDIDQQLKDRATNREVPIEPMSSTGRLRFDGAIGYLAEHTNRATALSTAKMIDHPTEHLPLPIGGTSLRVPALLTLGLLLALLAASLPAIVRATFRGRSRASKSG